MVGHRETLRMVSLGGIKNKRKSEPLAEPREHFFLLTKHPFIKLLLLIRIRTMQGITALEDSVAKWLRNSLWGLIHCRQCLHRTHLLRANSSLSLWGSQRKWKKWFPLPSNLYLIWDFLKNLAEMGYKKKKISRAAVAQWGDIMAHTHWSESKEAHEGDFPGSRGVKIPSSKAGDAGLVPGPGTKIPHTGWQLSLWTASREACAPQRRPTTAKNNDHKQILKIRSPWSHMWSKAITGSMLVGLRGILFVNIFG